MTLIIEQGRRRAEIDGNTVRLLLQDNKRRKPRVVRQGTKVLLSEADCWHSAVLWVKKASIDFGENERQAH